MSSGNRDARPSLPLHSTQGVESALDHLLRRFASRQPVRGIGPRPMNSLNEWSWGEGRICQPTLTKVFEDLDRETVGSGDRLHGLDGASVRA